MTARRPQGQVRVLSVDDRGVRLRARSDLVLDVLVDGRRVWSFWSRRDAERQGLVGSVAWPAALGRFLEGTAHISVVEHVSGATAFSEEVRLGSGVGRVAIADRRGRPLALDKAERLSRVFESRSLAQVTPLLDSMEVVLTALRKSGVDAFLAYGTLLGAVRSGRLISHDSDADLGYVSRSDQPVDAVLESMRIQRMLVEEGFTVTRYSGIGFRVTVPEADGSKRGLDVFGGLIHAGTLYLMGEVGAPFRPEWVTPLSDVSLEGRTFPAPAEPARLLEAMYGPSWRVPDPAYRFETSTATMRHLSGWFRGTRGGRDRDWTSSDRARSFGKPSALARHVAQSEPTIGTLVDVGCGSGVDALWFARRGVSSVGLDFMPTRYAAAARRARRRRLPARFDWLNLNEWRSVLPKGAELARLPGPRVVMARHVADQVDRFGRGSLFRLADMASRGDGRFYLQVSPGPPGQAVQRGVHPLDLDRFRALIEQRGGTVERCEPISDPLQAATDRDGPRPPHLLVARWGAGSDHARRTRS